MDWLNYHHLRYFWTVAKQNSVSKAAAALHVAQPTVNAQVRSLERSPGRKLFERQGRHLNLTLEGEKVFRYADEIFPSAVNCCSPSKASRSTPRSGFAVACPTRSRS